MGFKSSVKLVNVCLVMLGIVDLHRDRINVGFEGRVVVRESRKRIFHGLNIHKKSLSMQLVIGY